MNPNFEYLAITIVGIFLARAAFSIPKIFNHVRAQTILLAHIAEKLGVDANVARKPYFDAEGKIYKPIETNKTSEVYK